MVRENRAEEQAKAQLETVRELIQAYHKAGEAEDSDAQDEAIRRIEENILSLEVREGWHNPSQTYEGGPVEFQILLCTGGPAVRIIGDLDGNNEPCNVQLQYQDWGTPWTEYFLDLDSKAGETPEEDDLTDYCRTFCFAY